MRVCLFSSYPPNRARLSNYGRDLVRELAKSPNIDLIYIIADTVNDTENMAWESRKVAVIRTWKPDDVLSVLSAIPKIYRLRPDVTHLNIHFQSFGRKRIVNFVGLILAFILRFLGVKVLVTIHNLGEKVDLTKVMIKPTFINRIGITLAMKLLLHANKVAVTVKSYVDYLKERYGYDRAVYIRHGAPLNNSLKKKPSDPNRRVLLMLGHMGPHKGIPVLLEAFKKLSEDNDDIELIIAGADHPNFLGYLERYRNVNFSRVRFIGFVPEDDLQALFDSADLVILPYLTATGTSGVFHLACGYGKPIIASDLPEIREMVSEGASAILVPPADAESLKDAIEALLNDPDEAEEMAKRNLRFAMQETWDKIAKEYEVVYNKIVNDLS